MTSRNELKKSKTQTIKIASAYISIKGAQYLKDTITGLNLDSEEIEDYCSSSFNEQEPSNILKLLSTFSTVYIVHEPFLHSKVYELHTEDSVITYCGSANLTEGGLINNYELMVKNKSNKELLDNFWEDLWQNSFEVDDEVIALYHQYSSVIPSESTQKQVTKINNQLQTIYEQQCIESHYSILDGFYFEVDDPLTSKQKRQ
ncbi:restriction endonuclease PLD domain-containing protein [Lysinibacillus fusiformis]|uniref:phospholipase D family protein n=1 Tax=Lysinibacillus fusiformis TaxID=28031 RepID=UPI003D0363CF